MKISISANVPEAYTKQKGETYETRYIYTGFGRYNEHEKTLEVLQVDADESFSFFSRPHKPEVFSRSYHVELATVTLYSESPRVWSEKIGPITHFFQAIEQVGPHPNF
jgi:hypothetical protein